MVFFHELLNRLLLERKMRPVDLARCVRGDLSLVTSWLNGVVLPSTDMLDRIAQCLHIDKEWLRKKVGDVFPLGESRIRITDMDTMAEKHGILLPLLGRIWCKDGFWCDLHNERGIMVVEESRKLTEEPACYFLLESSGDRMEDYGIYDDDILFCCFQDTAESGDIVIVLCSDDIITVKEYWQLADQTPILRGNQKRVWFEGVDILEIQGKFLGKVKGRRIV